MTTLTEGVEQLEDVLAENRQLKVEFAKDMAAMASYRHQLAELQRELAAARAQVGEGWFVGGVTLAEAIERKCLMLEALSDGPEHGEYKPKLKAVRSTR